MANDEHVAILKQGVEVWNQWRTENPDIRPDLSKADLRGAILNGAILSEANFYLTDLSEADLSEVNLSKGNLHKANLYRADLQRSNLSLASITGGADLREANLSGASLSRATFRGVRLSGANFREADLTGALFRGVYLNGANFRKAILSDADFRGADLSGANLRQVDFTGAKLSGVDLSGADFTEARVWGTVFGDLDLSLVKGLETVKHSGPSTLGIDTIYKSGGNIPESFLRGCGVPDNFIAYMGSLTGKAFEYYSCFISYSTLDDAFAQRLHNDLQGKGVRCWFAPEHIKAGEKLYPQIDQAIRLHDKLLLILSEHSMHSEWVMTEIRRARQAELRDQRRKLFPIRLVDWETIRDWDCFDADTGKDLAVEVREYFVPDFSCWKEHDSYQQAFERLLRDLKASEA